MHFPSHCKSNEGHGGQNLVSHALPGAWIASVIWAQVCVNNIFLTVLGKVTQVLCAQKLVMEGELYKSLGKVFKSLREVFEPQLV